MPLQAGARAYYISTVSMCAIITIILTIAEEMEKAEQEKRKIK